MAEHQLDTPTTVLCRDALDPPPCLAPARVRLCCCGISRLTGRRQLCLNATVDSGRSVWFGRSVVCQRVFTRIVRTFCSKVHACCPEDAVPMQQLPCLVCMFGGRDSFRLHAASPVPLFSFKNISCPLASQATGVRLVMWISHVD